MIQKGIIAQVIDKYNYKVRIPKYDKIESATYSTKLDDLSSGIVCSIPGIDIAYVEDDVVLVSFENDELSKPVILGLLYREEKKDSDILVKGVDESLTDIKDDLDKLNSQGLFTHLKYSDDNGMTFTSLFSSQNYESNVGSAVVCQPYFDDESAIGIKIDKGTKAISWSILDENNTDVTDEIEIETIVFDSNNNIIKRERGRNNRLITINNSSKIDGELYLTYRIHTTKKYLDTLHVRLSTDKEPFGVRVGEYVGLYLSFDSTPSSTPADYTWFPIASGAAIDAEINSKIAKLAEEMNQLLNEFKLEVDENFVTLFYKEVTWTQSEVDTYCEIGYQDSWTRSLDGYQGEVKAGNILYITVHNTGSSASIEDDSYGRLEIRALEDTPAGQPVNGQVIGYNVSGEVAIDALARFKSSLLEEGNETLIYGGHITTGRIQDHSGNNYFDLDTGTFNFQDGNGEYIRQVGNGVEINGTLSLSSNVGSTTTLEDIVGDVADFAQDIIDINGDIQHLQDQIDHNVTAWFYPYAPTNSNYPASDWISQGTQNAHLGDIFYDTDTGYSYRWTSDTSTTPPTYSWMQIPDTGVARALQAAADAQDTADSKRRVFVDTPIPPYDIGDLWVQGSNGGILRCSQAKTENQTYSLSDWVAASKYTDDSALNAFTNGTYANFVLSTNNTLSNKITTFYGDTQPTATATGDLWIDTDNGNKLHRWNGTSWIEIQDTQIQQAISNAATAQSTADSKIVTFAQNDEPTATDIGDLWIDTNDNNKMYRWSGSSWVALSDTSALNTFISGTFATTVASLQTGIADAKVQTWYQNADPSLNWSTGDKPKHEGDMWYCTDTINPTYYGKYWLYDGSAWQEMVADPPQEVFDKIDGKANIFTGDSITPTGMQEGDLWFKGASYPILTYVKISSNPDTYEWREYNKYTDNSAFTAFRDGTYATFVTNTNTALGNKITTFYVAGPTGPTASTTGDLWIDTNDNNKLYRWDGSSWVLVRDTGIQTALTNAANAKTIADSKIITFAQPSQPTASDIGDLWIDTDANNKMYRWSGTAWVALTDKSALITFINGTFADTISQLEAGITDAKVETFYQTNDPSTVWTTSQKATHEGDMWYNSTSSVQKYYRWCKLTSNPDTYGWREMTASPPDEVFDEIDGKATIFTGDTTPIDMQVGDLWFKSVNDPILTYVKVSSDPDTYGWREYNKYTDDSGLTAFVDGTYATFVSNTGNALNSKITTYYQSSQPTTNVTGDLWVDTDDGNKLYRWNGTTWVSIQDTAIQQAISDAADAQSTADSKIITFAQSSQPTATDTGDLWIDTDDNNKMYRWSGTSWVSLTDTSAISAFENGTYATFVTSTNNALRTKITTYYQTNQPTTTTTGDLWIDTDDGNKLYRYDGNSWVSIQDTAIQSALQAANDAQSTADGKIVTFAQDAEPTASDVGDLWIDTNDNNKLYRWSGSSWVSLTDSSSLNAFVNGSYATFVTNTNNSLNSKITTYYQNNQPTTTIVGDLWIDTDDKNKLYRWDGSSWISIRDTGIQQALTNAADARSVADSKIVTFAQAGPTGPTATDVGDLWIDTSNNNKMYRWSGSAWVAISDTSALNSWISNTYTNDKTTLEGMIDGKADTWYQASDPSTTPSPGWNTEALKQKHVGDLWYNTTDKTTSRYNKLTDNPSTYGWVQQEIPTSVFNTINGKAQIFISQPVPPYSEGDLWFKGANEDILTCTTSKTSSGSYSSSDWAKLNKYTDDNRANAAYDKAEDANLRTQRIYYRKRNVGAPNKPTSWVTNTANSIQTGDTYDSSKWTTKIPPLTENASTASSATKYPYLYTCIQTQKNDGTNPTCSDVLLDENTVVIDGGSLIANSVSANEINTGTITVGSLQDGSNYYNTQQTTQAINTAVNNIDIGGTNLLRGSSILSLSANNAGWMANGNGNPEILEDYETYRCLHLSASMTGTAIPSIATRNRINLAWGKTYTVSCYLKFDKQIKIGVSTPMHYHVGSSENTNLYDLSFNNSKGVSVSLITPSANTTVPANTWVYVEQRITTAASAPDSSLPYPAYRPFVYGSVRSTSESVTVNTWMHSWMFSEGNKAADWSPAPEDALAKSQRIYKRTNSNNSTPNAPTQIISNSNEPGTTGDWTTLAIPRIWSNNITYKYLWTCEQQISVGGYFLGTTPVVADNGTTVIDGNTITTGRIQDTTGKNFIQIQGSGTTPAGHMEFKDTANWGDAHQGLQWDSTQGELNIKGNISANSLTIINGNDSYDGTAAINISGYDVEIVKDSEDVQEDVSVYLYPVLYHNGEKVPDYIQSTDTSVDSSKTYYTRSGSAGSYVYTEVTNPSGNPSQIPYYEKQIDYSHFLWYQDDSEIGTAGDANNKGRYLATYSHNYRVTYEFDDGAVGGGTEVQTRYVDPEKYITKVNDNEITIHPESYQNVSSYMRLGTSGLNIYNNSGNSIAQYGSTARVGLNNSSRFLMNNNSLQAYDNNNVKYFEVSSSGLTWGSQAAATTQQVSNLSSQLSGKANTSDVNQAVSDLEDAIDTKANSADVPTSVADLSDGANYSTTSQMNTAIGSAVSGKANISDVPTRVTDLTDSSNYPTTGAMGDAIDDAVDSLAVPIANAAKTATNYITNTAAGIEVHDAGDSDNFAKINSEGLQVYQDSNEVASFGPVTRIGGDVVGKGKIHISPDNFTAYTKDNFESLSITAVTDNTTLLGTDVLVDDNIKLVMDETMVTKTATVDVSEIADDESFTMTFTGWIDDYGPLLAGPRRLICEDELVFSKDGTTQTDTGLIEMFAGIQSGTSIGQRTIAISYDGEDTISLTFTHVDKGYGYTCTVVPHVVAAAPITVPDIYLNGNVYLNSGEIGNTHQYSRFYGNIADFNEVSSNNFYTKYEKTTTGTTFDLGEVVCGGFLTQAGSRVVFSIPTGRVFEDDSEMEWILDCYIVIRCANQAGTGAYIMKSTSGGYDGAHLNTLSGCTFYNMANQQKTFTYATNIKTTMQGGTNLLVYLDGDPYAAGNVYAFAGNATNSGYVNNQPVCIDCSQTKITVVKSGSVWPFGD